MCGGGSLGHDCRAKVGGSLQPANESGGDLRTVFEQIDPADVVGLSSLFSATVAKLNHSLLGGNVWGNQSMADRILQRKNPQSARGLRPNPILSRLTQCFPAQQSN